MMDAAKGRPRRVVVDNMRRRIERALAAADAAEELAKAVQIFLDAAEAEQPGSQSTSLIALRAALLKYRAAHDDLTR